MRVRVHHLMPTPECKKGHFIRSAPSLRANPAVRPRGLCVGDIIGKLRNFVALQQSFTFALVSQAFYFGQQFLHRRRLSEEARKRAFLLITQLGRR